MQDSPQINSAVDAVRCLYLARMAEKNCHADAAQRWRQLADSWLDRLETNTHRRGPSPVNEN